MCLVSLRGWGSFARGLAKHLSEHDCLVEWPDNKDHLAAVRQKDRGKDEEVKDIVKT